MKEVAVKTCYLVWYQQRIYVTTVTGRRLADFPDEAFGKGWMNALNWSHEHGYVVRHKISPSLARAPIVPGYYKRTGFSWVEITKSEYFLCLYSLHDRLSLLRIDKSQSTKELLALVRAGPWIELRKNGSTKKGKWVGDAQKIEAEVEWLERWAEQNGYQIGNYRDPDGKFIIPDAGSQGSDPEDGGRDEREGRS
jgi:hypothetical protein